MKKRFKKRLTALSIDTKGLKIDREEANVRKQFRKDNSNDSEADCAAKKIDV